MRKPNSHAKIASPADILRGASRVPSLCGEGTRDARLRMSAGEANAKTYPPKKKKGKIIN